MGLPGPALFLASPGDSSKKTPSSSYSEAFGAARLLGKVQSPRSYVLVSKLSPTIFSMNPHPLLQPDSGPPRPDGCSYLSPPPPDEENFPTIVFSASSPLQGWHLVMLSSCSVHE